MRYRLVVVLLALVGTALSACSSGGGGGAATTTAAPTASTISLSSSAFHAGGAIPRKYSCSGEQVSPPLSWSGVPSGAEQLALVVDDPDAGGFIHWVLVGIDPGTKGIAEGQVPKGAVEVAPYKGPCPPSGTHHYEFTLYALPSGAKVDSADPQRAIGQIRSAASARGELVGTFSAG